MLHSCIQFLASAMNNLAITGIKITPYDDDAL